MHDGIDHRPRGIDLNLQAVEFPVDHVVLVRDERLGNTALADFRQDPHEQGWLRLPSLHGVYASAGAPPAFQSTGAAR